MNQRHEGTEARSHEVVTKAKRHQVRTTHPPHFLPFRLVPTPCLRAFVPPCLLPSSPLRASVPVSLHAFPEMSQNVPECPNLQNSFPRHAPAHQGAPSIAPVAKRTSMSKPLSSGQAPSAGTGSVTGSFRPLFDII